MHLVQHKSPQFFMISMLFKPPEFKVSLSIQLLIVTSCKITNKSHTFNTQQHNTYIFSPRGTNLCMVEKYWTKSRLKHIMENIKSSSSLSSIWALVQRAQEAPPLQLWCCNIHLSLQLVPQPACSSPWQVSVSSDISSFLGFSAATQASLPQLHTMAPWRLLVRSPALPPITSSQQPSETTGEESVTLHSCVFRASKALPHGQLCQVWLPV